MTRGYSSEQDLRLLINNPKYSDVEILCKDEKKLHGCRAILAARSKVFDRLLFNRVGESYDKQISISKINSLGMEVIMEYLYTGVVKEKTLTKKNIVETFIAADYFQLPELQDFIVKTVKGTLEKNSNDNYSPELLSKILETMPFTEDNILSNLLVDAVSVIPLNAIEFEYEVFRYSAILIARDISNDATKSLLNRLPTLDHMDNFKQIDNELIPDHTF
ncbi:2616_t:CDS:2, partial [Funneliformis geosporum]